MNDDSPVVALVILILCCLVGAFSCNRGHEGGYRAMQVEAVKRGYAEWQVAADGKTTFAWKEAK